MCILCSEVSKENLKPKEFWSFYKEISIANDSVHLKELLENLLKTSDEYQTELAKQGLLND